MGVASYNIFLPIFFKHLRTLNLGSTYHLPLQHCIEHINRRPFTNNSYPHISPLTYLLMMKLLKCNIVTNWTCFGKIIKRKKKMGVIIRVKAIDLLLQAKYEKKSLTD